MINNKKAWLKIFEAFLAIIFIFGVMLVILSKQNISPNTGDEILKLQNNILDSLSRDDVIRGDVLNGKLDNINIMVGSMVPSNINYSISICDSGVVCPINDSYVTSQILSNKEIYSSEVLILSNSTSFDGKKLKLFFWRI
jgi:hypothetical protein